MSSAPSIPVLRYIPQASSGQGFASGCTRWYVSDSRSCFPRLPGNTQVFWDQAMLDVLFEYPIHSDQSRFSIHPGLGRLGERVVIVVRFQPPNGSVRAFEFLGDPGLVRLDPSWRQAALRFIQLGFFHILDGTDHFRQ